MKRALRIGWQRAQRRLGWTGLCGLALMTLSVGLAAALPLVSRDTQALERRVAQARAGAPHRRDDSAPSRVGERQALAELAAGLPTLAQNAADMATLFDLASAHKVALNRADYQLTSDPRVPLTTYSVTLPVRQTYFGLKQFSAAVLRALPHAALDELRLERSEAMSTELEARIRFTLIYRGQ